jgi:Transport and Golgi organisation 2
MCTVSWLHRDDGSYELLSNRDEKRTRGQALAPRIGTRNGVQFIAPIDSDHRGTWIGVNECGLSLCLLNGLNNVGQAVPPARKSRGLVVLELLPNPSSSAVLAQLTTAPLLDFGPFTLLILEPATPPIAFAWNGTTGRIIDQPEPPLISSSFNPVGVERARKAAFQRAPTLRGFHASHAHGPSAYSTCMHRPDAETVSFSHVTVEPATVSVSYSPAAPCRRAAEITLSLIRS